MNTKEPLDSIADVQTVEAKALNPGGGTAGITRTCKQCGKRLPLDRAHFRPRRKRESIFVYSCRTCEAAYRRERRRQRKAGDPNSARDPNERIVVQYVPEWIDDMEIAAMQAAEEASVEFVSDEEWEAFVELLVRQARARGLKDRGAMKLLATVELSRVHEQLREEAA
jgi:hypothetical protein